MTDMDIPLAGNGLIPALRGEGLMFHKPRPLVFSTAPVVVSWSAKSACTHLLMWFLAQEGLLRAAEYFARSPHQFRGQVYYLSLAYRRAATAFWRSGGHGYTLIRVTRAPHKRLVSIFRHTLKYDYFRAEMDTALGRKTRSTGVSLEEFGALLAGHNLVTPTEADVHLRAQYHPVWDLAFDRVITLNIDERDYDSGLAAIAAELGLPGTDVSQDPAVLEQAARRYAKDAAFQNDLPVEKVRFGGAETPAFAKPALEACDLAKTLAERLHGTDIGRVGSGDTAGRIFTAG